MRVDGTSSVGARLGGLAPARPIEVAAGRGIGPEPPVLATERMVLRAPAPGDRDEFLDAVARSRAQLERFAPVHLEGETDEDLFARLVRQAEEGASRGIAERRFAILNDALPGGRRLAGVFNLNAISRGLEAKADATWWVASDAAGRGLGTEGVRAILGHALDDLPRGLGLHAVHAWISPDNEASVRIARRLGFRRPAEGRSYVQTGSRWSLHELWVRGVGDAGESGAP